jgi:hypothetical protein
MQLLPPSHDIVTDHNYSNFILCYDVQLFSFLFFCPGTSLRENELTNRREGQAPGRGPGA